MDKLKQSILPYLKTSFEKDLLEAALKNLEDGKSKLRLNNFAYSARELTRHYLKRLAPDTEVLNAPWFKPNDPKKPKAITREQRIKYAIQGYLSDDFRENVLKIDLNEVSKNLRTSIDELSKYTHVEPETFDVDKTTVTDVSYNIMEDTLRFFKTINEAQLRAIVKEAVKNVLKECIDNQEERINAAVEALMSVREIVSRASDCWEYEDVNAPLFQQICAASSAIEGVMGFSKYGSDIRQQRNLEMSQQD